MLFLYHELSSIYASDPCNGVLMKAVPGGRGRGTVWAGLQPLWCLPVQSRLSAPLTAQGPPWDSQPSFKRAGLKWETPCRTQWMNAYLVCAARRMAGREEEGRGVKVHLTLADTICNFLWLCVSLSISMSATLGLVFGFIHEQHELIVDGVLFREKHTCSAHRVL